MLITKDCAVTLSFKITDSAGRLLDQSNAPMAYLHGGYDNLFPKLEAALEGQEAGFQVQMTLEPADAFGLRDESLVRTIAKKDFPPGVKVGGQLEGRNDAGAPQVYTVLKVKGDQVLLDGNHALAGKTLRIATKVLEVRTATAEEISHRHVHGAHGHHH